MVCLVRFTGPSYFLLLLLLLPQFRFGVRNHVAHHDWICGCEVSPRAVFPVDGLAVGRVLPRVPSSVVAVERKPFESPSTSPPSSRTETGVDCTWASLFSFPGGWVSVREESSFVGFFPGRIPGDLPRPRLSSSGFGVCELGRSPLPVGKSLRITTFTTPSVPPKLCVARAAPGQGRNAFSSFGPR